VSTFVLVHGHYLGVWAWKDVVEQLKAGGHCAIAAPLSGMGELAGGGSRDVGLSTHVDDVCQLLADRDLTDVVLVGHSYAGMVISGVAARAFDRLRTLIFLDAVIARHGQRLIDFFPGQETAMRAAAGDQALIAPPPPHTMGLSEDLTKAVSSLLTPVPLGTFTDALDAPGDRASHLPRHYIRCLEFALSAGMEELVRAEGGWTLWHLDSGHLPMLSHPDELTRMLEAITRQDPT
jgi:pimeloyl-ACP methyl ester carboxylesterase